MKKVAKSGRELSKQMVGKTAKARGQSYGFSQKTLGNAVAAQGASSN